MVRSDTKDIIANYIRNSFIKDSGISISDDTPLIEDKIIDSTGVIELVAFLEETFGVSVEDEEIKLENFRSLNKITDFVQAKIPQTISV
jgi:acyl carrier protein